MSTTAIDKLDRRVQIAELTRSSYMKLQGFLTEDDSTVDLIADIVEAAYNSGHERKIAESGVQSAVEISSPPLRSLDFAANSLHTVKEVASAFECTEENVRSYVRRHQLPSTRNGKLIYLPHSTVKFIAGRINRNNSSLPSPISSSSADDASPSGDAKLRRMR